MTLSDHSRRNPPVFEPQVRSLKRLHDEEGSRFNGHITMKNRYVMMNLMGKGGFSEVFKVRRAVVAVLRGFALCVHGFVRAALVLCMCGFENNAQLCFLVPTTSFRNVALKHVVKGALTRSASLLTALRAVLPCESMQQNEGNPRRSMPRAPQAFDLVEMREVAVKFHQLNSTWNEFKRSSYVRHAMREYNIHKELKHPHIVLLYDLYEIDVNSFATVLEMCEGGDLDTHLRERAALPEKVRRRNQ